MKRKKSQTEFDRVKVVGSRIRFLRENAGLSLHEVCQKLDEPRPTKMTLARWEKGEVVVSLDRLEQIARVFDIPPRELLGW